MIISQIFWIITINDLNAVYNIILYLLYGFWAIYFYIKLKKEKNKVHIYNKLKEEEISFDNDN